MNTAQFRNAAIEHEQNLAWGAAADCWQQAIEAYPTHNAGSMLAKRDLVAMEARRIECIKAYYPA